MDIKSQTVCDHIVGNPPTAYIIDFCPRCLGKGYYGGFAILSSGNLQTLSPSDSLIQAIQKILTENTRPTGYGFNQSLLTGVIDASKIQAVKNEVARCLNYLKFIQTQETLRGFQYNPQEKISKISNITVVKNTQDPRGVNVTVTVVTVSATSISTPLITLGAL